MTLLYDMRENHSLELHQTVAKFNNMLSWQQENIGFHNYCDTRLVERHDVVSVF